MRSLALPWLAALPLAVAAHLGVSCHGGSSTSSGGDAGPYAIPHPCKLPGSVQFTGGTTTVVPGNDSPVDLSFLKLPDGFCAHYYGRVGNARQLRLAPGGELFVASPTQPTTGGGANGMSAIVVLPDDDHDGVADQVITFIDGMVATQGMMFANGSFYYQDGTPPASLAPVGTKIRRVPYASGDRQPSGASEVVADLSKLWTSKVHWPKTLDIADDGTIYVGNGGDQGEVCEGLPHAFHGGIVKLDGTEVAQGMRNPIAVRCSRGKNLCFTAELAMDYTAGEGGREKLVPIRKGDDWGFPCCATRGLPYVTSPTADCSTVTPEDASFLIGDTPFGVAFEPGKWPGTWRGRAFVATHGTAGGWVGARVVGIAMDAKTGLPVPSTNMNGAKEGGMADFATGWDDATLTHGRPAAVEFSEDGRLFLSNDSNGVIVWIAPLDL